MACSHGSTSGAIDEEALFYLRSRGVPAGEATDLLTLAFLAEAGEEIEMTGGEFDILRCFVQNPLRPLTRQQILDETRGGRCEGYERSIDVLIGRIRRKIEEDQGNPRLIQTVRGIGYVFAAPVQQTA